MLYEGAVVLTHLLRSHRRGGGTVAVAGRRRPPFLLLEPDPTRIAKRLGATWTVPPERSGGGVTVGAATREEGVVAGASAANAGSSAGAASAALVVKGIAIARAHAGRLRADGTASFGASTVGIVGINEASGWGSQREGAVDGGGIVHGLRFRRGFIERAVIRDVGEQHGEGIGLTVKHASAACTRTHHVPPKIVTAVHPA